MSHPACHICGIETEFTCDDCGEPVCENCCVPMTIHNNIDYPLCTVCHDRSEVSLALDRQREQRAEDAAKAEKEKRSAAARERYNRPENVARRAAAKAERIRQRKELELKQRAEAAKITSSMFKGMF